MSFTKKVGCGLLSDISKDPGSKTRLIGSIKSTDTSVIEVNVWKKISKNGNEWWGCEATICSTKVPEPIKGKGFLNKKGGVDIDHDWELSLKFNNGTEIKCNGFNRAGKVGRPDFIYLKIK